MSTEKAWHPEIEAWLVANPMPTDEARALMDGPGHACACLGIIDAGIPRVPLDPAYEYACECSLRYERARRATKGDL